MMKRVLALALALLTVVLCLTACSHGELDKGAYIRMYLTEPVYDLDPLAAFDNEAALQLVSLLYEPLFYADEDGKPQKGLVDDYEYTENEEDGIYALTLTLKSTCWSDGGAVTANNVQYAFRRLFYSDVSHPATALLYDIKNARTIANGDKTVDYLGVSVIDNSTVEILFEKSIDVDDFLVTLCSPALIPLRGDDIVDTNADWAKSRTTIVCSGPFTVRSMDWKEKDGFILERNAYYYRDRAKDDIDKYVTPFRIVVDYVTDPVKQFELFNSDEAGALYYFGHIPLEVRNDDAYASILKKVDVTDAPSTHVYYLNQNAIIGDTALFADASVRKALSLAIDRNAIVEALVYAKAADGLVAPTLLNRPDKKTEFRKKAESYISASANVEEARKLLQDAGITPSDYSFSITVAAYDEDHVAMAELVKVAWESIGFDVSIKQLKVSEIMKEVVDDSIDPPLITEEPTGVYKNPYKEALASGDFEVIALDLVATSPDAFSMLAPFATAFSGNAVEMDTSINPNYELSPHITGYSSAEYDAKIEEAYAAEKNKDTAKLLHEAEAILMNDMPVIPIVYNQNVSLKSSKLKKVDTRYFCNAFFQESKLKGYWDIALRDEFITQKDLEAAEKSEEE